MANISRTIIGALLLGSAMSHAHGGAPSALKPPASSPASLSAAGCNIVSSSDWAVFVDAMPGPSGPRLAVTGLVGVKPANGTRLRLAPSGPKQRPGHVTVFLDVTTPTEPTIDLLTQREVRGEWLVSLPIESVTVRCGRKALARLSNIVPAH